MGKMLTRASAYRCGKEIGSWEEDNYRRRGKQMGLIQIREAS